MIEYIYKGFKLSYKIEDLTAENTTYKADGALTYLLNTPDTFKPKKFHTEYETHSGAEYEIKKMLENYVDCELKNFYETQRENESR